MAVSGVGEMGVDLSGWGIQVNRRPLNPSGLGTHSGRRGWKSIFVVGFGILPNKVVQEESLATAVIHPPLWSPVFPSRRKERQHSVYQLMFLSKMISPLRFTAPSPLSKG